MGIMRWLLGGLIAGLWWLSILVGHSLGAEITVRLDDPTGLPTIMVRGQLLEGDDKKFAKVALELESAQVDFHSPGGNLLAGLGIGKAIRLKEFVTKVGDASECASACGLAWLGGIERLANPDARIGFHAAYVEKDGQPRESGSGNALVGAYLNQLSLPQAAIVYLTSAPPNGMQWLPLKEAKSFGIDLEIIEVSASPEAGRNELSRSSSSLWEHNGSVMRLIAAGPNRVFIYESPRKSIAREGVTQGTVLFNGVRDGENYVGEARVFSKKCGTAFKFSVKGRVINESTVLLEGDHPVYADCQPTSQTRHEQLLFTYLSRITVDD